MKLKYVEQALNSIKLGPKSSSLGSYMTEFKLSDYIRVLAYHNANRNVYELQVIATVGIDRSVHYKDLIKVIDKCTELLTDLTQDLRTSMYEKLKIGELNQSNMNLDKYLVDYKLTENGVLDYRISINKNNFHKIPPVDFKN